MIDASLSSLVENIATIKGLSLGKMYAKAIA